MHSLEFFFSGSPIKRIGRNQFIRNILIAMGNYSDQSLTKIITTLLDDISPLVRLAAVWALSKTCKDSFLSEINKRIDKENDKEVINEWLESKKEINKFLFT
jgi:epoxyqueuosine reductase